jgi:hypothetical protein
MNQWQQSKVLGNGVRPARALGVKNPVWRLGALVSLLDQFRIYNPGATHRIGVCAEAFWVFRHRRENVSIPLCSFAMKESHFQQKQGKLKGVFPEPLPPQPRPGPPKGTGKVFKAWQGSEISCGEEKRGDPKEASPNQMTFRHLGPNYPSAGCSSAEPASVSLGK